jgi:hypothetical protein
MGSRQSGNALTNPATGLLSPGVCGPDVTDQVTAIWTRIQQDFRTWTEDQQLAACTRILIPIQTPQVQPGPGIHPREFIRSMADINGWDVLPLFQGSSTWLRSLPVYDPATRGPCATPSSLNPSADSFDDAHESPLTCSNSVQVSGQCWLNGTVNYGTYGIMVRLCRDRFTRFRFALEMAVNLIRTYKKIGAHPEDSTLPIAWVQATFHGGPTGRPTQPGNRPQCKCTCPCRGNVVSWDYVWEPVKSRMGAIEP